MLHLGRADAVRQRAEGAVRRGMAVAADHGHAGKRPALFGADDMHDALPHVADGVVMDAELLGVLVERRDLDAAVLGHLIGIVAARRRGHVVVGHGDGLVGRAHRAARHAEALEGLRAGDLVHEVAVDIEQAGAVLGLMHEVGVPELVVERLAGHGRGPLPGEWCGWVLGRQRGVPSPVDRRAPKKRQGRRARSRYRETGIIAPEIYRAMGLAKSIAARDQIGRGRARPPTGKEPDGARADPRDRPEARSTSLLEQLTQGWAQGLSFLGELLRPWNAYQVLIVLAIFLAAWALKSLLGPRIRAWMASREGWPTWRMRILVVVHQRLRMIFFVACWSG
jgi:hypothetical protein